ncbi:terminase large subunit, partial [Massilia sp. 2TAF26]
EELIERSDVIDVGIDGGGLDDLLALTAIGRCRETRRWLTWARAWAHPSVLERRKEVASRLIDFANAGQLVLVKRIGDDVDEVAALCAQMEESGKLDKIGVDPSGLGGILDGLIEAGIPEEKIVGISQG